MDGEQRRLLGRADQYTAVRYLTLDRHRATSAVEGLDCFQLRRLIGFELAGMATEQEAIDILLAFLWLQPGGVREGAGREGQQHAGDKRMTRFANVHVATPYCLNWTVPRTASVHPP